MHSGSVEKYEGVGIHVRDYEGLSPVQARYVLMIYIAMGLSA